MKKVVIVGVGALGSHLVQFVRSVPDIELTVVDFDRVEQKNTLSQFHAKNTIRKNKTTGLASMMKLFWGVKLNTFAAKLTADNVEQILHDADLVVDCLDNAEARKITQTYCREHNIELLHGGLAADGQFGIVEWDETFTIDDAAEGAATCEDGQHLPFIAMTSAVLAKAVQSWLQDGKKMSFSIFPTGVTRNS